MISHRVYPGMFQKFPQIGDGILGKVMDRIVEGVTVAIQPDHQAPSDSSTNLTDLGSILLLIGCANSECSSARCLWFIFMDSLERLPNHPALMGGVRH